MLISEFHTVLFPLLDTIPTGQIFILVDEHTVQSCLPILQEHCPILRNVNCMILPSGETAKSLSSVEKVWHFLFDNHATRQAILINIGGGVVTDLGGFAAATYMRGIRFINIPTTLLAMVDASTGGKTGINFHGVKNGVGTFSQPLATFIYPPFLSTLSSEDILSGFAEMIKHGFIASATHYQALLAAIETWVVHNKEVDFASLIEDSLQIKQSIVDSDFCEKGLRRVLNFGHTIGHAIEEMYAAQNKSIAHGYCVMWGMVAELYLSVMKVGCPQSFLTQASHIMIEYYGRPQCDCPHRKKLIDWMRHDKKNTMSFASAESQITFTLLQQIGQPIQGQTATDDEINETLEYLFSL